MNYHKEKIEKNIFVLLIEDNWFDTIQPIGFFTTREKAESYKHNAQKDKKRWKHCRFFIQEYPVDTDYIRYK